MGRFIRVYMKTFLIDLYGEFIPNNSQECSRLAFMAKISVVVLIRFSSSSDKSMVGSQGYTMSF